MKYSFGNNFFEAFKSLYDFYEKKDYIFSKKNYSFLDANELKNDMEQVGKDLKRGIKIYGES